MARSRNLYKERQQVVAERAASPESVGASTGENEAPPAQPGTLPFSIDQLFAALGAKEFEIQMLRGEIQRLNQVVVTYKNLLADFEQKATEAK